MIPVTDRQPHGELERALNRLIHEVRDGLEHGFFNLTVNCEVVKGSKRQVTINAGKSHRFVIPKEELQK